MDEKLLSQLRASRQKTEELENRVISSLENERDHIATLKNEIKIRSATRNSLILELVEMGFTAARVAKHAGIVPSYITELQKNED